MQRAAFDPDLSSESAAVVLDDSTLEKEIVKFIVDNTATFVVPTTSENPLHDIERLRRLITKVANGYYTDGPQLFSKIVHDAHARMIGDTDAPVEITGEMLVPIVRNEAAMGITIIVLPVEEVKSLSLINHVLDWLVPILALVALLLALIAFASHPEKETLFRSLALGLIVIALLVAIVGYLVPRFVLPMLADSSWSNLPAGMADDSIPLLIVLEVLLIAGAGALIALGGMRRQRRRWSQPISTFRYNEDRRWS